MKFNKSERMFAVIVTLTVALLLMALAKPFKIIKTTYQSMSLVRSDAAELMLSASEPVRQNFAPQFGIISGISIPVHSYGGSEQDAVVLKLYDAGDNLLYEGCTEVKGTEGDFRISFPMNVYVEAWNPLYYELYSCSTNEALMTVYVADINSVALPESGSVFYEGSEQVGFCVCGDFTYKANMGLKRTLLYDAVIGMLALVVLGVLWFFGRPLKIQKQLRVICYALTAVGSVAAMIYCVFLPTFSKAFLDRSVYAVGIIVLTAYLCFAISKIGRDETPAFLKHPPVIMLQNYLQSVFFGISLYYCCMYLNAACIADQYLALSQIGFYFGLFMISLFTGRDLFNIPNAIWLVAGIVACRFVPECTIYKGGAIVFGGLVLIYIVRHMKKAVWKNLYLPIAGVFVLYSILTIVFRGNRFWMIYAGIAFTLFLLYAAVTGDSKRILSNVSNGITVSFLIILSFSLARRPYNKWGLSRYPMWFHTVTVTATYITLVASNAWGHILKSVTRGGVKGLFWRAGFRILEFSVACGYLALAISRTGAVTMLILILMTSVIYLLADKTAFRKLSKAVLLTLLSVLLCLPLTFTMTRIVPALVSNPFRFPLIPGEHLTYLIDAGEPKDSEWFMDVSMYFKFVGIRVMNGTTDNDVDDIENQDYSTAIARRREKEKDMAIVEPDISNGRFAIWKETVRQLGISGHDTMSVKMPDGSEAYHTHNAYLQALYDYGILIGALYIAYCLLTFIRSIILFRKGIKGECDKEYVVPLSVVCAFGLTGLFEITALPMSGITFSFMVVMCLLSTGYKNSVMGLGYEEKN